MKEISLKTTMKNSQKTAFEDKVRKLEEKIGVINDVYIRFI